MKWVAKTWHDAIQCIVYFGYKTHVNQGINSLSSQMDGWMDDDVKIIIKMCTPNCMCRHSSFISSTVVGVLPTTDDDADFYEVI